MKNKIVIVAGDPNSINSEILYKTWNKLDEHTKKKIYIIGNFKLIYKQFKTLKIKLPITEVNDLDQKKISDNLKIINIPLNFKNAFKVSAKNSSKYLIKSLNLAHHFAMKKKINGFISCPTDKKLIKDSTNKGVTEFLAKKCKIYDDTEVMLIHNKKFSVVPLTTHINLKNVSKNINSKLIIRKISSLEENFYKIFKKKPKIGILGLNPHNGELKKNSEEKTKILPAIVKLRNKGIKVFGPLVADTIFIENYKKFDVLVGMYHDQVLTPFKALFQFDAISITLGLNYIRVSPDHGPAQNLIKKDKANYLSLLRCVEFISSLNK